MKSRVLSILLVGIGFASCAIAQQCPIGCQPQITTLTNDLLHLQTITPKIKTSALTATPQIGGTPPVPGTLDLKPHWPDILLIQVAVGENAMSMPFFGDMQVSGSQIPARAVLSVPCASGPGAPATQGSLTVSVEAGPRRLTATAAGCKMTVLVTLLLRK